MMSVSVSRPTVLSASNARIGRSRTTPVTARSTTVVRAAADSKKAGPVGVALKAFGALTALQLAILPFSGPALADNATGAPVDNQTDGAKTGETRANYKGLGDIKGPKVPNDTFAAGATSPDTAGGDTIKQMAADASNAIGQNSNQLSKAGDILSGTGGGNYGK